MAVTLLHIRSRRGPMLGAAGLGFVFVLLGSWLLTLPGTKPLIMGWSSIAFGGVAAIICLYFGVRTFSLLELRDDGFRVYRLVGRESDWRWSDVDHVRVWRPSSRSPRYLSIVPTKSARAREPRTRRQRFREALFGFASICDLAESSSDCSFREIREVIRTRVDCPIVDMEELGK